MGSIQSIKALFNVSFIRYDWVDRALFLYLTFKWLLYTLSFKSPTLCNLSILIRCFISPR